MTFGDIFKKDFLEGFTQTISFSLVLETLAVAVMFSIILYAGYLLTSSNVVYSKKFNVTMSMLCVVTAAVVLSLQANIALSLGMVGALSIVRFRTAIKEPRDLLFLFWSISTGIVVGGNLYGLAAVLALVMLVGLLVLEKLPGAKAPYFLVAHCDTAQAEDAVEDALTQLHIRWRTRSRSCTAGRIEMVLEFNTKKEKQLLALLAQVPGLRYYNLLSQEGEAQFT